MRLPIADVPRPVETITALIQYLRISRIPDGSGWLYSAQDGFVQIQDAARKTYTVVLLGIIEKNVNITLYIFSDICFIAQIIEQFSKINWHIRCILIWCRLAKQKVG